MLRHELLMRPTVKGYAKIIEWSDEDQCYIGRCPDLMLGGCHGDDERAVFEELCQAVDDVIALYQADHKPLPPPNFQQKINWITSKHGL